MNGSVLNTLLSEPVLLSGRRRLAALLVVLSVFVLRRAGPEASGYCRRLAAWLFWFWRL